MSSSLFGTKSSDAIPPSDCSFSFTTDGLDSRLLPTLARTTEWKDQPRLSAAQAFPSTSTSRSRSPHASRADNSKRDSSKPRTSSISRFFHHHHAQNPIRDSLEAIIGVQAGAVPRSASRGDGRESSPRAPGSRRTTDSGYSSSRRPSSSSDGSSYSSSTTGLNDDARSENTSSGSGSSSPTQSLHSSTLLDSFPISPTTVDRDERTPVASTSQTSYFDLPGSSSRKAQVLSATPIRRPSATPTLLRRVQSAEDVRSPASLYADVPSHGVANDVPEASAGSVQPIMSSKALGKLADSLAKTPGTGRTRQPSVSQQQRRPRSMHEVSGAPPTYDLVEYPKTSRHYHARPVAPRDDEGREGLPHYSNHIHLEGYFEKKDEFSAPGIQSRDRSWKRKYIVIRGTSIKVYKHDLRTHPIEGEVDSLASSPSTECDSERASFQTDYFHRGEYGATPLPALPISIADARGRLSRHNALLRTYSLQNAESGVATDYYSREFVVRIRAEGEQFLLQAQDPRGVVDLIETLQAATNVALDLDQRNLPVVITIPRRRRRIPAPPAPDGGQVASGVRTPPSRPEGEHRTGF